MSEDVLSAAAREVGRHRWMLRYAERKALDAGEVADAARRVGRRGRHAAIAAGVILAIQWIALAMEPQIGSIVYAAVFVVILLRSVRLEAEMRTLRRLIGAETGPESTAPWERRPVPEAGR